jgi:hypothetical protein
VQLHLKGVGCKFSKNIKVSGREPIYEESLLGKLRMKYRKKQLKDPKARMKMCICICMYQEDWGAYERTMNGVQQNILDMYVENTNKGLKQSWEDFIDQFLIILIADGFMNVGNGDEGGKNFRENAIKKGFFRPEHVEKIFAEP